MEQLTEGLTPYLPDATPLSASSTVSVPSTQAPASLPAGWRRKYEEFLRVRVFEDNPASLALYRDLLAVTNRTISQVQQTECPLPAFRWKLWRSLDPPVNSAADLALLTREQVYKACIRFHWSEDEDIVEGKAQKRCSDLEEWFLNRFGLSFLN